MSLLNQPLPNFETTNVFSALSAGSSLPPPLEANPTLNERMFSELFCPGLNLFTNQSLGLQFALPCWERSGHVRDLIGGSLSTAGSEPSWRHDQKLTNMINGKGIEIVYRGQDLGFDWTITFWLHSAPSNDVILFQLTAPSGVAMRLSYTQSVNEYLLQTLGASGSGSDNSLVTSETPQPSWFVIIQGKKNGSNTDVTARINDATFSYSQPGEIYHPSNVKIGDVSHASYIKDVRIYNSHLTEGQLARIKSNPDELYKLENVPSYSPSFFVSGGILAGGSSDIAGGVTIDTDGLGGIELNGSSPATGGITETPSGGIHFKGSSIPTGPTTFTSDGTGLEIGYFPSLPAKITAKPDISGGLHFKGTVDEVATYIPPNGGISLSGSSNPINVFHEVATGGVIICDNLYSNGFKNRTVITVPASEVDSDVEKFYLSVVFPNATDSDYDATKDGNDLDVLNHRYAERTAWLVLKTPLDSSSDNLIYLYHD